MKYFLKRVFLLSLISVFPCWAGGQYFPGTVQLITYGSTTIIYGNYNVRYNPAVSQGSISAAYQAGSSIVISATDSTTGVGVSCSILSTDAIWATAEKAMSMITSNGTQIWATKSNTTNKCTQINITTNSGYMD